MKPNKSSRRRFLKATGATGLAAVGLATASSSVAAAETTVKVSSDTSGETGYTFDVNGSVSEDSNLESDDEVGSTTHVSGTVTSGSPDYYTITGQVTEVYLNGSAVLEVSNPNSNTTASQVEIYGDDTAYSASFTKQVLNPEDLESDDHIMGRDINGQVQNNDHDHVETNGVLTHFSADGTGYAQIILNQ